MHKNTDVSNGERDLMPFDELYQTVGFPAAYAWEEALHL
jgi:hypothetical protein